jgi:hypothetical protein
MSFSFASLPPCFYQSYDAKNQGLVTIYPIHYAQAGKHRQAKHILDKLYRFPAHKLATWHIILKTNY